MLVDFHQGRAPGELGAEDISAFLADRSGALSPKTLAQCWSALAFFYRHVEQRPEVMTPIPRCKVREAARLPPPHVLGPLSMSPALGHAPSR
ncbi:MAG: phage integrase N-terminal SAM-like domain-containing protein [Nannocystaceae bacterium]